MNEKVKVFKAIGDETRLKILILLSTKNVCAKGIAKHLEISEAAVSQHIKTLKEANLVIAYKDGYYVMYELNKEVLENAKKFTTLHPRCGTNFLFIVMFTSIILFSFFGWPNPLVRVVMRILFIPIVAGISYEIIKFLGKYNFKWDIFMGL